MRTPDATCCWTLVNALLAVDIEPVET